MGYSVVDYFEADTNLKKAMHEIARLKHTARKESLYAANVRMKIATDKVYELIEIFTWETVTSWSGYTPCPILKKV